MFPIIFLTISSNVMGVVTPKALASLQELTMKLQNSMNSPNVDGPPSLGPLHESAKHKFAFKADEHEVCAREKYI